MTYRCINLGALEAPALTMQAFNAAQAQADAAALFGCPASAVAVLEVDNV